MGRGGLDMLLYRANWKGDTPYYTISAALHMQFLARLCHVKSGYSTAPFIEAATHVASRDKKESPLLRDDSFCRMNQYWNFCREFVSSCASFERLSLAVAISPAEADCSSVAAETFSISPDTVVP